MVTDARKTGRKLAREVGNCEWTVTCVDPEHLSSKEWHEITDNPIFRSNIFHASVDEAHLINEWGEEFRLDFRHIGSFLRARLPSTLSITALTATLQPGQPTQSVCDSLGFIPGNFFEFRRSNERPNLQFVLEALTHGLGGDEFPDLLFYILTGRKTVIYCATIELCWRVYIYLIRMLPPGPQRINRIRLYHAMCWPEQNVQTVDALRDDPDCQIVIATIAFGQGFNVRSLLDSILLGVPSTADLTEQERGRAGRDLIQLARGIVLYQPRARADAIKYMRGQ
jgi:superfamily II DNA helicase RecQ